jgi:hypothetical protein
MEKIDPRPTPLAIEVVVADDLQGLSTEEVAKEEQMFKDRAQRVRRRLTMNQAFMPPTSAQKKKKR